MPGAVRGATAMGTLPYALSTQFTESRMAQVLVAEYHDGSSQRLSLVTTGRRSWKLSRHLSPTLITALRDFAASLRGGAFYFYSPFETVPVFSRAPSGTAGRYLVRFNSDWSQINGMNRSDCELEIVEVSA
jgi:phage-related protein